MERLDVENWIAGHPDSIRTEASRLLDTCEFEVRSHAKQDAWVHACEIAEASLRRFERVFGLPASDTFVTREVCHEIARELKHHEPHPDEAECAAWVSRALMESVDQDARRMLQAWIKDLGTREEHEVWRSIVAFADHLARKLIRDSQMTSDLDWDFDHSYPRVAARVARMMIHEFEVRAAKAHTTH